MNETAPAPAAPAFDPALLDALATAIVGRLPKAAPVVVAPPPPAPVHAGPKTPLEQATERFDSAVAKVNELAENCEGLTITDAQATGNQRLVRMVQGYGDAKREATNAHACLVALQG